MSPSPILDGRKCLNDLLLKARYDCAVHAVADHAIFLHPDTVRQTGGHEVFRVIRYTEGVKERGECCEKDGVLVMKDDNRTPTNAFLWAANRGPGHDVRYCHIWPKSRDYRCYTALWNLCVLPEFLAKLSDTDEEVKAALRYHAFDLYHRFPSGEAEPVMPSSYGTLRWVLPPPPVESLERVLRERLQSNRKSRAAQSVRECGWLFSGFVRESIGS
jgi:hypothetical protein